MNSGINRIDFESEEAFSEEEQKLIASDPDQTTDFIRSDIGLDPDRLSKIEGLEAELGKKSKFSWKEYAKKKMLDEIVNAAKDRFSLVQLLKLFEFLGSADVTLIGF